MIKYIYRLPVINGYFCRCNMSKKDEEILLVDELGKRVDNLKTIDKPGPFFREVARLAGWMGEIPLFERPLFVLDLQNKKRSFK